MKLLGPSAGRRTLDLRCAGPDLSALGAEIASVGVAWLGARATAEVMATLRMHGGTLLPHLQAVKAGTALCLNCETALVGEFCHGCGQSAKTPGRITLGTILREIPNAVVSLNRALPFTILSLLYRPGHLVRDYLEGRRAKIYSPVALLFLLSGFLGLANSTLHLSAARYESAGVGANAPGVDISETILAYYAWFMLLWVPIQAVGPLLVLRRRLGLGYGEQVVAAAMFAAGSAAIGLLFVPLEWIAKHTHGHGTVMAIGSLVKFVYIPWAYAQLQQDGRRPSEWATTRWARGLGGMVATIAILCAGIIVTALAAVGGAALYNHFKA